MQTDAFSIFLNTEDLPTEILLTEIMNLRSMLSDALQKYAQAQEKSSHWQTIARDALTTIFAPKSERRKIVEKYSTQLHFDEIDELDGNSLFEEEPKKAEDEEESEQPLPPALQQPRPKPRRKRKPREKALSILMESLEVGETVIEDPKKPNCPNCHAEMGKVVGYDTHKELVYHPGYFDIRLHKTPIFTCDNCEKHGTATTILHSERELARPIPRCVASPELLADILYEKVVLGTPFYRLEQHFSDLGIPLSRATMTNWLMAASENWLAAVTECMHRELLKQDRVHIDESYFQVLSEPGRKAETKGYTWIFCSPIQFSDIRYVVLFYTPSRNSRICKEFLNGFQGYVITDGLNVYTKLIEITSGIIQISCWAHNRRGWFKGFRQLKKPKPTDALAIGFEFVERIFLLEQCFEECTAEERFQARRQLMKPVMDAFHDWLLTQPRSQTALGKAVSYTLNHWEALYRVLEDGRLPLTNAAAELIAKNFAVGRKNFLFSNTPRGADALMAAYSVVETAKANNMKPRYYLEYIFREMPKGWRDMVRFLVPARQQLEKLTLREMEALGPPVRQALEQTNPQLPVREMEKLCLTAIRQSILDPARLELAEKLEFEAKVALAREFMPDRIPTEIQRTSGAPARRTARTGGGESLRALGIRAQIFQ